MSVSASIEIQSKQIQIEQSVDIIHQFLSNDWAIDDNGSIVYLPIGDKDFEWTVLRSNLKELFEIIGEKVLRRELIGVNITFRDTSIGGNLLINENELQLILSINRKMIHDLNITDFSWYLNKIPRELLELKYKKLSCIEE